jgi:hypothetical protein
MIHDIKHTEAIRGWYIVREEQSILRYTTGFKDPTASYRTKTSAAATQRRAIVREFVIVTEACTVQISSGTFEPSFGLGSP